MTKKQLLQKDEILKIKEHIEIHARRERSVTIITKILRKAVDELEHITSIEEENQQLKQQLENEKQLNAEIKKRLVVVEYDCEEFNHEYCDINCKGKRKELVDLYQLISDGLNETLLKQKEEEIKRLEKENEQLQKINNEQKETLKKVRVALIQERTANIMNYGKGGVEIFDNMLEVLKGVSN